MLLSRALASSHMLVLCLALCTFANIHAQQNKYIAIYSQDKDHYIIRNKSSIPFQIIRNASKDTVNLRAKGSRRFLTEDLKEHPNVQLFFSKEIWKPLEKKQLERYYYYKAQYNFGKDWDDWVYERSKSENINKDNENKKSDKEMYRLSKKYNKTLYNNNIKPIRDSLRLFRDLHKASLGEENDESENFQPINVSEILEEDPFSNSQVNPSNLLYGGITLFKSGLGDNWDNKGEIMSFSYQVYYARKLFKELKYGNDSYALFYGFLGHDRYGHDLKSDKTYYVGNDYTGDGVEGSFYRIVSSEKITLRNNQLSAGVFFRMVRFSKGYGFDIGLGYNFYQWSSLFFKSDEENSSNPISGATLRDDKFTNVLEYEGLPLYGLVRFNGILIKFKGGRKTITGVYVEGKVWQQQLSPSKDFEVYEVDNGVFQKITITDDKELFYTINFGLTFGF